jgi:hypothetical protein
MSKLKFNANIFVGVQEWNKLQENIRNSIIRNLLINTDGFGIVRQLNIPEIGNIDLSTSFYVSKSGTPYDEVIINEGAAIDIDGNFIINPIKKHIKIPADNVHYSIVVSYDKTNKESGLVSVDSNGAITGLNTDFTKTLRGFGEFNSRIRFLNSVNGNSRDYEVAKVFDDVSAILIGDFTSESNLEYGIFGTFLDGYQVPIEDAMILEHDYFKYSLILTSDEEAIIKDREFLIARVFNSGVDVTVEDVRSDWWESEAMSYLKDLKRDLPNRLLGVESVKWDLSTSPKDENIVQLGWNFRCSNYTIDTNSKKISLLIGQGGIFKDTSYFSVGDFTNWRVYSTNGKFVNVIDSQKTGTQIVLTTDVLIPEDFNGVGMLYICPPFEGIEFKVEGKIGDINEKIKETFYFNINDAFGVFRLKSVQDKTFYSLRYRYKTFGDFTSWKDFNIDSVGYYDETSYDEEGNLQTNIIDRNLYPYNPAIDIYFLKLIDNTNSYAKTIYRLDSGDLLGVNKTKFTNENPIIDLYVGKDRRYQHYSDNINSVLQLQSDSTIILHTKTQNGNPLRDGNVFFIQVTQFLNLNNFKIKIVQNYENATTFQSLMEFTENDICFIKNGIDRISNSLTNGIFITATWSVDFKKWILTYVTDEISKGTLKMLSNTAIPKGIDAYFNAGIGNVAPYFGWILKNDFDRKYLRVKNLDGLDDVETGYDNVGGSKGSNSISIGINNLPYHTHDFETGKEDVGTGNQNSMSSSGQNTEGFTKATGGAGKEIPDVIRIRPEYQNIILIEKIV